MDYSFVLNLKDNDVLDTQIMLTQGDYGVIRFLFDIIDDGEYITDAVRVSVVFRRHDGTNVSGYMTLTDGKYVYELQGSELAVPGKVAAEVKLFYENGRVSSGKFLFGVRPDPLSEPVTEAGPFRAELQRIIDEATEAFIQKRNELQALIDLLTPEIGGTYLVKDSLTTRTDITEPGQYALDASVLQNLKPATEVSTEFTPAPDLANLVTGEELSVMLGKLARWYVELTGKLDANKVVNNLLTTEEGFVLDARQGKALAEQIVEVGNQVNSDYKLLGTVTGIGASHNIAYPETFRELRIDVFPSAENDVLGFQFSLIPAQIPEGGSVKRYCGGSPTGRADFKVTSSCMYIERYTVNDAVQSQALIIAYYR